jgi:hypothetical protein
MSKPINYYIQLSDSLSTSFDEMSKADLLLAALEVADDYRYMKNVRNEKHSELFGIAVDDMPTLMYGLLAKAI